MLNLPSLNPQGNYPSLKKMQSEDDITLPLIIDGEIQKDHLRSN